ncbi:hypothetical protein RB195_019159 [Necator americanus]|uniref:Uncharacterized protein n=1 Tax=Necator americanus TaxID=51031 RepID=A0ABR1CCV2_NECAM
MMQEALDLAIEDTCRGFGLLSPYTNEHDIQGLPKIDNDGLEENRKDGLMPGGDAACGSLTYDGIIFMERSKKFPASHYHIEEMNKGPVDHAPRLARIPSQYQLESLTEVYVCDYPTLFTNSAKQYSGEMDVEALTTAFETNHVAREPTELHQVYSEYVSEVLY